MSLHLIVMLARSNKKWNIILYYVLVLQHITTVVAVPAFHIVSYAVTFLADDERALQQRFVFNFNEVVTLEEGNEVLTVDYEAVYDVIAPE